MFLGGTSIAWGGAIDLNDGTLKLSNTILSHNVTHAPIIGPSPYGGGLFVDSLICSLVNVTCAYNTDYNTGDGIDIQGGTVGITNSIVFFNGGANQIDAR